MEILKPLVHLSKELTLEAGKGVYDEVIAPELGLTQQQQETVRVRSRYNKQDLIALIQIQMEEELLLSQLHYPGRMVARLLESDPQLSSDVAALGEVRSQLAHVAQPPFITATLEPPVVPIYPSPNVATMDAGNE